MKITCDKCGLKLKKKELGMHLIEHHGAMPIKILNMPTPPPFENMNIGKVWKH